jgi:hypothetical protein
MVTYASKTIQLPEALSSAPPNNSVVAVVLKRLRASYLTPWSSFVCKCNTNVRVAVHIRRGDVHVREELLENKDPAMAFARVHLAPMSYFIAAMKFIKGVMVNGTARDDSTTDSHSSGGIVINAYSEVAEPPGPGRTTVPELEGFEFPTGRLITPTDGSLPFYLGTLIDDPGFEVRFLLNTHPMVTMRCMSDADILVGSPSHFTSLAGILSSPLQVVLVPKTFDFRRW